MYNHVDDRVIKIISVKKKVELFTLVIIYITIIIEHFNRLQTFKSVSIGEPVCCSEKNMEFGDKI